MVYAGFVGDSALFSTDQGGLGWTVDQVWKQTISPLVALIAIMILLTAIVVLAGGLGFAVAYRRDRSGR